MKDVQENLKIMNHKFGTAVKENHKLKSEVRDLTSRLEKGSELHEFGDNVIVFI